MKGLTTRLGRAFFAGALVLLTATVTTPATAVAASSEDNQLEMKAREQFAAGRYDDAKDTFAKLYAKSLNPIYLRNIGRCYQKKREPQQAIDQFQDYLAKTKTGKFKITADERAEIEGYIREMQALSDEQARAAAAPPPPPVQPLAPPGPAAQPMPAAPPPDLSPNAPAATLTATAPPPEEHHSVLTRWWFWTIVGAVVVGGVVTAVVLSSGSDKPACPADVVGCK
jgi:hypothetical protein